jgi:hypothetical protein
MATARFVRSAGLWLIVGALIQLISASVQALSPVPPGSAQFVIRNVIVAISHVPVLIGIIGLVCSGAAGNGGWLAKLGLSVTLVGSALLIPFELMLLLNVALGEMLLGFYAPLTGLGLVLVGIATLRAGYWQGWRRFTPLLCGLYPFLVLIPVFAASGGPNFWAIAGWQVPFVLLGLALRSVAGAPEAMQSAVAV